VVATRTIWTPESVASSARPPWAQRGVSTSGGREPGHQARAAGWAATCCKNSLPGCPAARARTAKRSGWAASTSSACRPIEPVEPRTATPIT
jgi:hypothetical protein